MCRHQEHVGPITSISPYATGFFLGSELGLIGLLDENKEFSTWIKSLIVRMEAAIDWSSGASPGGRERFLYRFQ